MSAQIEMSMNHGEKQITKKFNRDEGDKGDGSRCILQLSPSSPLSLLIHLFCPFSFRVLRVLRGSNAFCFLALVLTSFPLAADAPLPLPPAPVRVVIPDATAFDAALTGDYRRFLTGDPQSGDPVVSAWRKTQVGSKLEDQWLRLSKDLPLTWNEIRKLQPKAIGIALLEVGHLEAVLVIETPLAQIPLTLPKGIQKSHGGVSYALVAKGAGDAIGGDRLVASLPTSPRSPASRAGDPHSNPDASEGKDRRMGLAWGRMGGRLIFATSERAMRLTIDEAQAGRGFAPPLAGLVSMELNLETLRKDRYFRREFLFPEGPETGRIRTALRQEGGRLIEVREGGNEPRQGVFTFEVPAFAAAGWEPEGQAFWPTFRRSLLEPIPAPLDKPVAALAALPTAVDQGSQDRYAVNLTRPLLAAGAPTWEEGDLVPWNTLLAKQPITNWGFWLTRDGVRRMAFAWPEALDGEFLERCRTTVARRAGRATLVKVGDTQEIRIGPGLAVLALRRTGRILWVAPSAQDLKEVPTPRAEPSVIRWAKVDLDALRAEAPRWAKVEGPARPEQVRPLSDRILGLLGWMPATTALAVERRRTAAGWEEKVTFGSGSQ